MTKAPDFLQAALKHMQDRAATYDKPEGERSIPNVVTAFNAMTGHSLTAEQGWLFQLLLKACRTQQGDYRPDNYEDGSAYFALMGEQAASDRVAKEVPPEKPLLAGTRVRRTGATSNYYVKGREYEIVGTDPDGMLVLTDEHGGRHPWSLDQFRAAFSVTVTP
ncbi:hypothetical protein D3C77_48780 [compost metagenome]